MQCFSTDIILYFTLYTCLHRSPVPGGESNGGGSLWTPSPTTKGAAAPLRSPRGLRRTRDGSLDGRNGLPHPLRGFAMTGEGLWCALAFPRRRIGYCVFSMSNLVHPTSPVNPRLSSKSGGSNGGGAPLAVRRGPGETLWNGSPGASLPSFAALRKKVAPAGAKYPSSYPRPRRCGLTSPPLRGPPPLKGRLFGVIQPWYS